jgi:hypothetical protein
MLVFPDTWEEKVGRLQFKVDPGEKYKTLFEK